MLPSPSLRSVRPSPRAEPRLLRKAEDEPHRHLFVGQ